jgi:hypothetical protein
MGFNSVFKGLKYSVLIVVEKIYKCNIWRVAVGLFYIWDAGFLKVTHYVCYEAYVTAVQ